MSCLSTRAVHELMLCAGAFSPHPGHDIHLHPTLSAIQILATHDALDLLNKDKIVSCQYIHLYIACRSRSSHQLFCLSKIQKQDRSWATNGEK